MNEIIYGGLEYETNYRDYILGGKSDLSTKIELAPVQDDVIYEYNQKIVGDYSCTIHACAGAVSDLMNYEYTTCELKNLWEKAIEKGADPYWGWYFYKAVDLIRNEWNKNNPDQELMSFRLKLDSDECMDALNKGYSIVCGYKGNKDYNLDKDDGVVDGVTFGDPTYGHCVRVRKKMKVNMEKEPVYILYRPQIVDNYTGVVKNNIYYLKDLKSLIKNEVYYNEGYLYIKKSDMKIFTDVDENHPLAKSIAKGKDLGITKGYEDGSFQPGKPVTRGEALAMIVRMYEKLNKDL